MGCVLAVVTLATPHTHSPAHLQPALAAVYRALAAAPPLPVPLLAVTGGGADVLVPGRAARVGASVVQGGLVTQVDTERLPGVWAKADHQVFLASLGFVAVLKGSRFPCCKIWFALCCYQRSPVGHPNQMQ